MHARAHGAGGEVSIPTVRVCTLLEASVRAERCAAFRSMQDIRRIHFPLRFRRSLRTPTLFGSPAIFVRSVALRPRLTAGLPFSQRSQGVRHLRKIMNKRQRRVNKYYGGIPQEPV